MAAWGRVHARILQDIQNVAADEARRMYGGQVPDAAVFHELVMLAETALGTGGPPVPADAPLYEAPRMEPSTGKDRAGRYLVLAQEALEVAKRAQEMALAADPELALDDKPAAGAADDDDSRS